jgi:transcriptional regulator of acetoin/glycerol metabolism
MKQHNNTTLEPNQVQWLRAFADTKGGVSQAASFLGLSRNALTRAVAALPIHRGTAALLAQQIAKRQAEGKASS